MNTFQTEAIDLGRGISVEFKFSEGRLDAVWSPRVPYGRRAIQIMPAYRRARHVFLSDVAEKLGITIAVADIGPDSEVAYG